MEQQQIIFEVYCRDCYGGFGCAADKESHNVKRGKNVRILQENCRDLNSAQFKHWVKQREFKLIPHLLLGLGCVLHSCKDYD